MGKLPKNYLRKEYKKMKNREKAILEDHEQLRKEYGKTENFIEAELLLKNARRQLNEIKQVL